MKRIIHLPSGTLEYADEGQGRPVLFLHGGHGNAGDEAWHKPFDPRHFRLLTPSRPGYGRTPLQPGANTPADAARLMAELLDALHIGSAVVVGISAGGYTALELAARRPQRVQQLLLVSAVTRTWLTPADAQYQKARRLFSPGVERLTWAALKTVLRIAPGKVADRMFGELSAAERDELPAGDVRELRDMLLTQSSGQGFLNDLEQRPPSRELLAQIACPVLIQHSRYDNSVPADHARHAHANIRHAILKWYDNRWGHLLWLGADARTAIDDARAFVAGHGVFRVNPSTHLVAF